MNQLLIKQTAILSAILGGFLGVLTLIPIVRNFSFLILLVCASAVVLVYMKKNNLIGIIDIKEGAIIGAVIGFVSFIAFSIAYIPLVSIIGLIFKGTYNAYIFAMFKMLPFFVTVILVIFIAMLSALMNAFTGLATAYVYEILSGFKKEENENVEFEIKE